MTKKRAKKKITLKKLAVHDTLWHEDSRLVFKSKTQKLVVGMLDDDDKSIVVNDETLELCEKWGFKIDPALVESESDEDDEKKEEGDPPVCEENLEVSKSKKKLVQDVECAALPPSNLAAPSNLDASAVLAALATVSQDLAQTLNNLESKVAALTSELGQEKQARKESDEKMERIRRQFFD